MFFLGIKFVVGLILLLFSTEKLVRLAERISKALNVSPLIIGLTVVAIGTSIPELVVSVISILKHDSQLAMGNIIGSNVVNVLLVLPVAILMGKLKIGRIKTQKSALFLLLCTGVFFIFHTIAASFIFSGLLLILFATIFSILEYKWGADGRGNEDIGLKKNNSGSIKKAQIIIGIFLLTLIVFGGLLIVDSVEAISIATGLSTSILGLTLTAIATSLPELLTTIYSQNNKQEKLTIGNILGSNVYNLMLIGGIVALFPQVVIVTVKEWLWLGSTTLFLVVFLKYYSGRSPSKLVGIILFVILFLYLRFQ